MTAHEQPISYLDNVLNEEESRCEYSHQWRNFSISRSGRFKSKNRKRDVVDGRLFDAAAARHDHNQHNRMGTTAPTTTSSSSSSSSSAAYYKQQEQDKYAYRQSSMSSKSYASPPSATTTTTTSAIGCNTRGVRDKAESYKSYYETNL